MSFDIGPIFRWAAEEVGEKVEVVAVEKLKSSGPWLVTFERRGAIIETVLKAGSSERRGELACESAALTFAESQNLPAPRVVAADLEGTQGWVALLMTRLTGSSGSC